MMSANLLQDGRLVRLSSDQQAALAQHRIKWEAQALSTAPADRSAAEHGVELAYRAAGLAPPERIVWCASPIEMARVWEAARYGTAIGPNVRDVIVDKVADETERSLRRVIAPSVQRLFLAARSVGTIAGAGVVDIVTREVRRSSPRVRARILYFLANVLQVTRGPQSWAGFHRSSVSPYELAWLQPLQFLHEICRLPLDDAMKAAQGLALFRASAGWLLAHRNCCWIADRPTVLGHDGRGRLHGAKGPALAYRDGWSYYAWKGNEIAAPLIEHPEKITIGSIDREDDGIIRRCMIEIMTPARFIANGGATRVSHDETGTLWRRTWATGDTWAAVEVVNGTTEPDGTRRHYYLQVPAEMRTARAAVAWTYGMPEHQYALLAART